MTETSSFGVGKREGHDASAFYGLNLYSDLKTRLGPFDPPTPFSPVWGDRIHCQSSETLPLPDNSAALAFTSPPYNSGKAYPGGDNLSFDQYLELIRAVGKEVYRTLIPGGRYVVNVANLGRKPYIPLNAIYQQMHYDLGFLPMGEIIWIKAKGAGGSCAWGSWRSASAPRLRDLHEYLLVFCKELYHRPDKGESDIDRDEFMAATTSTWNIPPASAKRIGHPAPFPIALAERVIRLYSYVGDVVLDPFAGSGTTCVAAKQNGRHWVGVDTSRDYCDLAEQRLATV
jgi:DNA modification methylase